MSDCDHRHKMYTTSNHCQGCGKTFISIIYEQAARIDELEAKVARLSARDIEDMQDRIRELAALLRSTVPYLIRVSRLPNIEGVADGHNSALDRLEAALKRIDRMNDHNFRLSDAMDIARAALLPKDN